MKDVKIKCNSVEEADAVLQMIEDRYPEVRWYSGDKPTGWKPYSPDRKDDAEIYFDINDDCISYDISNDEWHKDCDWTNATSAKRFLRKSSTAIHIYQRGRMVIAHESQTGREAVAKCSPSDTFNFNTGASIALARLMSKVPATGVLNPDVRAEWTKLLGITETPAKVYTDEDRNFKVGDRVVVRDWDDMAKEYGVSKWGDINKDSQFTSSMKHLCGRTATVTCVEDGFSFKKVKVDFDDKSGSTACWTFNPWMFNPTDATTPEKGKPEAKFKVGDYVTLEEDVEADKWYDGLRLLSGTMYDSAYHKHMKVVSVDWQDEIGTYYYECEGEFLYTFHYSEQMLDKWDESKICEGDKVRIKKGCTGNRFDLYYEWVKEHISDPDLLLAFEREDHVDTSLDYEVVKIAPHKLFSQKPVAYIKHKDDYRTLCYLFDIEALEKV